MTLHIQNPEAGKLAHELASRTGLNVEDAVLEALRERADHIAAKPVPPKAALDEWEREIAEIGCRCAALPDLDPRAPDDILYDENGLPY